MANSIIFVLMSMACFLLAVAICCFFVTNEGKTSALSLPQSAGLSHEFPIVGIVYETGNTETARNCASTWNHVVNNTLDSGVTNMG